MIDYVRQGVLVSIVLLGGCQKPTEPLSTDGADGLSTTYTQVSGASAHRKAAVANLLDEPTVVNATILLATNGADVGDVESVADGKADADIGLIGADTLVSGVTRVTDGESSFILLPARLSVLPDEARPDQKAVLSKSVFVFSEDGDLLRQVGGGVSSDGRNGDNVIVASLATSDAWFAVVTRRDSEGPFDYHSEVYLISGSIPKAFSLRHSETMTFSASAEPGSDANHRISFLRTGRGVGADGANHACAFQWNSETGRFHGPSKLVSSDGTQVFQVKLSDCTAFVATDVE